MKRLLIANRGEIACRIARSARALGITTVAVYSDVDADALHVQVCDEAFSIGREGSGSPYLDVAAILAVARLANADALHPGYGFLSEKAEFATAVIAAGLVWVGPPPEVMACLGRKDAAKALAASLGVPVVPGFEFSPPAHEKPRRRPSSGTELAPGAVDESIGAADRARAYLDAERRRDEVRKIGILLSESAVQTDANWEPSPASGDDLAVLADAIGFPVLIKAVAGGGGRGMRLARNTVELLEFVPVAAKEALSSFGDGALLVEKFIERGRHIEVQILGDAFGTIVHLGERECSIQRRHQKLIEESPSPLVDDQMREAIAQSALLLARGVGYVNAGTVEFLVDVTSGRHYFLEVNTRIQVEHGVTEMVTGQDLVAWQLQIAGGQPLGFSQQDVQFHGHAIEVRLCAEDPSADFAPQAGAIALWRPPSGDGVRCDHGLREKDQVSVYYDAMIAKLLVWAPDRRQAIAKMQRALCETKLFGLRNNRMMLLDVLAEPHFRRGQLTTRYLTDFPPEAHGDAPDLTLAAAALWKYGAQLQKRFRSNPNRPDITVFCPDTAAPLHVALQALPNNRFAYAVDRKADPLVSAAPQATGDLLVVSCSPEQIQLATDGKRWQFQLHAVDDRIFIQGADGRDVALVEATLLPKPMITRDNLGSVTAPNSAVVAILHIEVGQRVAKDDALVTLESMKMLNILRAPREGVVAAIFAGPGQSVAAGTVVVEFVEEHP